MFGILLHGHVLGQKERGKKNIQQNRVITCNPSNASINNKGNPGNDVLVTHCYQYQQLNETRDSTTWFVLKWIIGNMAMDLTALENYMDYRCQSMGTFFRFLIRQLSVCTGNPGVTRHRAPRGKSKMRHRNDGRGIFDNADMVHDYSATVRWYHYFYFPLLNDAEIFHGYSVNGAGVYLVYAELGLSSSWRKENKVSQYMGVRNTEKKICGSSEFIPTSSLAGYSRSMVDKKADLGK